MIMAIELNHFRLSEFNCSHTGKNNMNEMFLSRLDQLRDMCGFPFVVNSGYRDETHPLEAKKETPGKHSEGIAADIKITDSHHRYKIVGLAVSMGFKGIGVGEDFVHIDDRGGVSVMWTY